MSQRDISQETLNQALGVEPSRYYHDGLWKLGYYDPSTRTFVGRAADTIKTVTRAAPGDIDNLKANMP